MTTLSLAVADSRTMLRRNVRTTPLPGFGDTDALDVLAQLPEMCVFSSDFPHQEGNAEPIEVKDPVMTISEALEEQRADSVP